VDSFECPRCGKVLRSAKSLSNHTGYVHAGDPDLGSTPVPDSSTRARAPAHDAPAPEPTRAGGRGPDSTPSPKPAPASKSAPSKPERRRRHLAWFGRSSMFGRE
jgi:hypothetical protein